MRHLSTAIKPPSWQKSRCKHRCWLEILVAFVMVLALAAAFTPGEAVAVSPDEPVAGIAPVTAAQLEAVLASVNPRHIHPNIARLYVDWSYRFGIRADVAFAQMLHETNFLRYGGDVRPEQNNLAGIGVYGGSRGNSFPSPEAGVIAHLAHLAWYVYPDHINGFCNSDWDPRHFGNTHQNTVRSIRDLGGRWAVPGNGYGEALARYATEVWNYNSNGHRLGSFNEVLGTPSTELSTTWYFTWYDSLPANGMAGDWILVGNQGTGTARVQITVGGQLIRDPANPGLDYWSVPEGSRMTPSIPNLMGGPVKVVSLDGQPLIASQRVLYRDSFNEVLGTTQEHLADSWEFTWYDSLPQNFMAGNWVLVANVSGQPADVEIVIGGRKVAQYSAATGNPLWPGQIITPQFPGLMAGPVQVRSTNHQNIIASQRVLFKDSFNELMGLRLADLGSEYYFTWYDQTRGSGINGDWVLVANRGNQPADVDIYVGSQLKARYSAANGNPIPGGGIVTPQFPDVMDGPVRVISTNGQQLMASQRILFRDSFEEVQGTAPAGFGTEQLFTWYDSMLINYMKGNWILVANQGTGAATVEIYIGVRKMHDPGNPGNDYFTIPEGGRITPQFFSIMDGPVRVVSLTGQPLLTSQRVLFKEGLVR